MYILGLTGPIASGKTTVSAIFQEQGITVIDADEIAHNCYIAGTPTHANLIKLYGKGIACEKTGTINRISLSKIIQADPMQLKIVESIVHPQVRIEIKKLLCNAYNLKSNIVVLSIPLMFENDFNTWCDSIVCCSCNINTRHQRFMERDTSTEEKWLFINSKQMAAEQYAERSDHIIKTDISKPDSKREILHLIHKLGTSNRKAWDLTK